MKVLIMIFALHFFLGAMLFIKMGSPDVRKGLRQASELMVKNSSFRQAQQQGGRPKSSYPMPTYTAIKGEAQRLSPFLWGKMKHAALPILLLLVSCGKHTHNRYIENPYDDTNLTGRVTDLEAKVASLESSRSSMMLDITNLENNISDLVAADSSISTQLLGYATRLNAAENSVALLTSSLLTLQENVNIVEIVDPCGDTPLKYDEVLFKTSDGQFVGSFSDNSSGLNTRFSVLPIGSYVTTDATNCHFQVTSDGNITWAE